MNTLERINRLGKHYGLPPLKQEDMVGQAHETINTLDSLADHDTSGGIVIAPIGRGGVTAANYVGKRLSIHESIIKM
jgi:hypothetical protein